MQILRRWAKKTGHEITELRSDGGREFVNKGVQDYLTSIGAVHKVSPSYTQALNGLAESNIGKIKDTARCMLLDSNFCLDFLPSAVDYAVQLSNLPIHPFTKASPYQVWYQRAPKIDAYQIGRAHV